MDESSRKKSRSMERRKGVSAMTAGKVVGKGWSDTHGAEVLLDFWGEDLPSAGGLTISQVADSMGYAH